MLIASIEIFRAALQPYIDEAEKNIITVLIIVFLSIVKYIFTPNHPSISVQYRRIKFLLVMSRYCTCNHVTGHVIN